MIQDKKLQEISDSIRDEIITIRRTFHQYPELSWKEFKTAERIVRILQEEGLRVQSGICGTGVIAEIGEGGGRTIAVRADMDALPMYDAKDVPYASNVPGVMHACGHDSHMAIAIGVAKVLRKLNLNFLGRVRFIFQPSEEATPSGAEELVKSGVMDNVDEIFAFHVDPEIPAGKIGLREGLLTAHCNEFNLSVLGKSGHAARPHHSVDTIFLSTQVLNALYEIVGNRTQAFAPAVLSIGKLSGGTKANVLPERVDISGSVRTIDEQTRNEILKAIEERASDITRAAGGSYQLEFLAPVPSVRNDSDLVRLIREIGETILSEDGIVSIKNVSMGGEDFAWYQTKAKGALIRLGARKPNDRVRYLHSQDFDIDESALPLGVSLMSTLLVQALLKK
ncbi:amidohydrolase [candidate division KSB1 bacterium]|nr:amidohydrolase [candidate division KSB1 bacterium]